eukprot:SAG11_NODE_496_length_8931_cov_2.956015_2_plen_63_part_00
MEVVAEMTRHMAGEETLRASDGLAPARCGGLMMSLFTPRLAALGANGCGGAEVCCSWCGAVL